MSIRTTGASANDLGNRIGQILAPIRLITIGEQLAREQSRGNTGWGRPARDLEPPPGLGVRRRTTAQPPLDLNGRSEWTEESRSPGAKR